MKHSEELRQKPILRPLFRIRDAFMEITGLFKLKAKIKNYFFLKRLVREDELRKKQIDAKIHDLPDGLIRPEIQDSDIVVSLTSYGKRVTDALPYALYSLLTQTSLPKKIFVVLDYDHWNNDNLPDILKKIQRVGVDFYFGEDLKSYKKLIPALQLFPDNPILTMDDDMYYHSNYIEWMTAAYSSSDKKTVLGQWGCIPEKKDGKYIPYNQWKDCKYGDSSSPISFFGCCCCYPPHIFDDEILKKEVFMELCPTADDIWFWVMEERQHIKRAYIPQKGNGYHTSVNRIEEYDWSQKGTLMHQNVVEGKNNRQLEALLKYYNLE